MLTCTSCNKELGGGIDTFGPHDQQFCQECWWDVTAEYEDDWYGMAPHRHNLGKTGSFIGSTEFVDINPDSSGWVDCSSMGPSWAGWWFKPDEETDGYMGVYTRRKQ